MDFHFQNKTLLLSMNQMKINANAITERDVEQLHRILSQKWTLILCQGTQRVFCSGGDLKAYSQLKTKSSGLKIHRKIKSCLKALEKHTAHKVAFVGGDCWGGGLEFLACFDKVIAAPGVYFGFWQNKQGLSFGWGGFQRLQKKIRPLNLKTALLEEKVFTAFEMKQMGMIDQICAVKDFSALQNELDHLFQENPSKGKIQQELELNEESLFKRLWWSREHLERLKKSTVL